MTPLISIIIPIYNKSAYIDRCFTSIINQTLNDFEVIVVDDGSTDNSLEKCKKYESTDSRFRLFHQSNAGVSAARQTGLDYCRGKYIIHVDPDDTVEPQYLESLYKGASNSDADMVICDFYYFDGSKKHVYKQNPGTNSINGIKQKLFLGLHASCWNKLIKSEVIKGNVSFPAGINMCEDLIFIYRTLPRCKKIEYVNVPLYNYYYVPESISHNNSDAIIRQLYNAYLILLKISYETHDNLEPWITASFCGHILPRIFQRPTIRGYEAITKMLTKDIWTLPIISFKTKLAYYLATKKYGNILRMIFR